MDEIELYRQQILQALTDAKNADGTPRLTEQGAKKLAQELTNDELADGMMFNTPEEVADLLLESGLE